MPVHTIQPHGVLLVLSRDGVVRRASANSEATLRVDPGALVGRRLDDGTTGDALARLLRESDGRAPRWSRVSVATPAGPIEVEAFAHVSGEHIVLELEAVAPFDAAGSLALQQTVQRSVAHLHDTHDVASLCDGVARHVRDLTGFARVTLYRFGADGDGAVIAESFDDGLASHLGRHLPAADVPPPARALLVARWLCLIPDAGHVPLPLVPDDADGDDALDLTRSLLAAASPLDRAHLARLGVGASLTISLVRDGALWGLVTCHHPTPRHLGHEVRNACELLGRLASILLSARAENEARSAAEAALQARDHVLAVVSHDLRNPLGVIDLGADWLSRNLATEVSGPTGDRVARTLDKINRACRRMNGLVEDVLQISRIEAGGLDLQLAGVEANTLLRDAHDMLEPLAAAKSIALRRESSVGHCVVRCQPERIMQVFSNLVGNAIKFTPEGGEIVLALDTDGADARFAVRDTGPGIPAELLAHVFDRFWQARPTRQGAGLGLAIAKGLVEAHGGRIWVESTFGAGATFYFTLPRPS